MISPSSHFVFVFVVNAITHDGRSINKLQNGVIVLIFKM